MAKHQCDSMKQATICVSEHVDVWVYEHLDVWNYEHVDVWILGR
jgi:hypothetical protein